ncbi:hypothetical protein [Polyangium fumosum]|uniref:Uncharacterized protein n=1 Tax=Polyangium fumosum TaxID=889272 RepID=A0A4U1IW63_9BACT|nr:hypothetical protein [Polyangium fumosum]TKC98662.1 hypothetical protein E8A74_40545 [Polyangium fumosum]
MGSSDAEEHVTAAEPSRGLVWPSPTGAWRWLMENGALRMSWMRAPCPPRPAAIFTPPHIFSCIIVLVLAVIGAGCGKLSKDKAREILQKKYDADSTAYCSIDVRREGTGATERYRIMDMLDANAAEACIDALMSIGSANQKRCMGDSQPCDWWTFEPGDTVSVSGTGTFRSVKLPCGEKKLLDVVSVTTEERTAKVLYKQSVRVDESRIKGLASCKLSAPKDGIVEKNATFKQDDDGNWYEMNE